MTIFITLVFLYSLVSGRLERTILTSAILFTALGMLTLQFTGDLASREGSLQVFLHVAEVGLVLLLFTDASRTDVRRLRSMGSLPIRLLSTGMLMTLLLGALGALVVFPQLSIWEAGVLSAILAPTDAGLGQIIVTSPRVPLRVREALNVEAGLNDGLSVPFLMFFLGLILAGPTDHRTSLAQFIMQQLGYGVMVGGGIGLAGGWLMGLARRREWMAESLEQIGVVVLPLLCVLASEAVGASIFIAAFVAGLAVQGGSREAGRLGVAFAEDWGKLLNLSVFFLFGLLVASTWRQFDLSFLLYAVLSLTIVRMLPVAIALFGTRLSKATVLFMAWFGPRGLASIVLGLVYLEQETRSPGEPTIRLAVMVTVLLSILAHGLSASPGINAYAARVAGLDASAPENQACPD